MMDFVIWDIDNCLSDDGHRLDLIMPDQKRGDAKYEAYHAQAPLDMPAHRDLFWALHPKEPRAARELLPVFITARPDTYRIITARWLQAHLSIQAPVLYMRRAGDDRATVDIKRDLALQLTNNAGLSRAVLAIDDRMDVLNMYKTTFGFPTLQLKINDVPTHD